MDTFFHNVIRFINNIKQPGGISNEVTFVNPYQDILVRNLVKKFYSNYFNDNKKRVIVFGINPGRFGGGLTGIPFTDPVALREECGIENNLGNRKELSSEFIYEMINAFGGVEKFYSKVFLTALYPLALIKNGKNFNFYDDKTITKKLLPHIKNFFKEQVRIGEFCKTAISLGKRNFEYFKMLNDEFGYFREIVLLEHPRFIMQYKRKKKDSYIKKYIDTITKIL